MTYLLGQIVLCLVLALLAGWYVGWTWRGFRDKESVEDLRHTLRATEEVKDRELAEAQRRADGLEGKVEALERLSERMADEIAERAGSPPPPAVTSPAEIPEAERPAEEEHEPEGRAPSAVEPERDSAEAGRAGDDADSADVAGDEAESASDGAERLREVEQALADKTAVALELQAEIASLRSGAERRSDRIARLEARLVELEPLEEQLERRTAERDRLRSELESARDERASDDSRLDEMAEKTRELEEAILERDRRINALRQRSQETAARLEVAEADQRALRDRLAETSRADSNAALEAGGELAARLRSVEKDLAEARAGLQGQIERNRKQEAVHQQVVANLRAELRGARPGSTRGASEENGRIRQLVADHDAHIHELRRMVRELATRGNDAHAEPRDDLQRIRGIGPKLEELLNSLGVTRFAQIAAWGDVEVEEFGRRLGPVRERIHSDDWIENARRQHILEYGEPPKAPRQGS